MCVCVYGRKALVIVQGKIGRSDDDLLGVCDVVVCRSNYKLELANEQGKGDDEICWRELDSQPAIARERERERVRRRLGKAFIHE